ncbi:nitric oxide reductase activation protein NorD [Thiohalobacter thiocyanaticus]|uniref:VWA domain-containing protein n=1 Tax=Thiohalobacter thiocyanaticus TaxID=585455 RepID=A0A426QIX9_9GAMM|nr:VWA domain-containing protein [Thiohalobacter thiocyanaticus]RRQ21713.1 VWA domain-containing protein [Thiohalobacter thiocyanaticus]
MTINLDDYRDCFEKAAPEIRDTLESTFLEASRVMSPAGLQEYMEGGKGLCSLGRGHDLVLAYLEEMPMVAKEVGEDVIRDVIAAAMKLSSMTSGEVIALMFASLPTAARRLGDAELVRSYLQLIHQMSAKAPRGMRPMLRHIDELLSKLTLGGLRRWVNFGAEAYRRDLNKQVEYFDLKTADSLKVLQKERRGTLFIDVQRKLNFYLRAFWGRDFFLRPAEADSPSFKPYIENHIVHLPDAVDDIGEIKGLEIYRAIAAHASAHMCYSTSAISAEQLSPAQMFFIGLIEDARVEYCAGQEFPGLKRLWKSLMQAEKESRVEHPTVERLEELALMLLEGDVSCDDDEISAFAGKFLADIEANKGNNQFSWDLGMELFHVFAARKEVPSLRILESIRIPYRDDNRIVWEFEEFSWEKGVEYLPASKRQVRRTVSLIEMVNELDVEFAGDDAQEVWRLETPFWLDQEGCTINELEGKEPISDPYHYQEWDYQVQLHRPDWVTLHERRQPKADPGIIDDILVEHRPIAHRIRQIIDMLQPEGVQRVRNMEDGDEIDINAAVDAMISIRMGEHPNPRITMRNVIKSRDLAVVVLLDLSESTNETVNGSDKTVLQLTREACALVATAIDGIGDPFAIHGFASDGRHDVQYYRFKDFNEKFSDEVKSRLAGMQGGLSTRMGAAMRHAGQHLLKQPERRKLLLLVTDGEPADIDERDPQYLRHDTKKAVEELYSKGVMSYCLTLDAGADDYVKRIFGANNYTIIDQVERLPEKLPVLFATLTS